MQLNVHVGDQLFELILANHHAEAFQDRSKLL